MFPLKDVQVLDDLTEGELSETTDEQVATDEEDDIALFSWKRSQEDDADAERSSDEGAEENYEAEVREELVDQGPAAKVGAVLLVPDDAVEQGRTDEGEEEVVDQESQLEPVQFVKLGKRVFVVCRTHGLICIIETVYKMIIGL